MFIAQKYEKKLKNANFLVEIFQSEFIIIQFML